ncbi:hypothetical protein [Fodinicola feengrottensis]|uniref:Uncharacterized protein n=1 Tax=Fodinicola feengrottensis TaxID=435914 RepID=A0ABN2IK79_9ACTN|nr:hypothetical protein [Fodinicola feengrottensis]
MRLPYDSLSVGTRSVRFGLICAGVAAAIVVLEFLRLATSGSSTDMMVTLVDGFLCGISAALSLLGLVLIGYGMFRGAPRRPAIIGLLLCWLVLTGLLGFLLAT